MDIRVYRLLPNSLPKGIMKGALLYERINMNFKEAAPPLAPLSDSKTLEICTKLLIMVFWWAGNVVFSPRELIPGYAFVALLSKQFK